MFYSDHDDGEIQVKFDLDLDIERSTIFRIGPWTVEIGVAVRLGRKSMNPPPPKKKKKKN